MPNDLTTLSGALLEMKDELIYQLGQKGVTATYSSSDGLLGLIGRISDIQTGGGSCYKVDFNNASYNTGGTATVSVTVLKNYSACVGETVTFTSSTSTTTTATTNSNGVATATISFSGSTTLTATIGGASDTATIVVSSYLFYDACDSATGLSNYGSGISYEGSGVPTITYDSTENAYKIQTAGNVAMTPITDLEDVNDFVFEADIKRQSAQLGIGVALGYHYGQGSAFSSSTMGCWLFVNSRFQNLGDTSVSTDQNWSHMSYTLEDGINGTVVLTNSSNTQYTKTFTLPSDYANGHSVGLVSGASGYCFVKNIQVSAL